MIVGEALAGAAIVSSLMLPKSLDLGFRVSSQLTVGLPARWCVPVLLLVLAGIASASSLLKMCWTLAHH
jgi:hypothetical protein